MLDLGVCNTFHKRGKLAWPRAEAAPRTQPIPLDSHPFPRMQKKKLSIHIRFYLPVTCSSNHSEPERPLYKTYLNPPAPSTLSSRRFSRRRYSLSPSDSTATNSMNAAQTHSPIR